MATQIPVTAAAVVNDDEDTPYVEVTPDLALQRLVIVNAVLCGRQNAADRQWVLVDTGVAGATARLERAAARRFGPHSRPAAIIMTHGHADHAGGLAQLARAWDVPVYAHRLEMPYLNGSAAYPPPDPLVGGLMSLASPLFPRGPFDVRDRLQPLPEGGAVPFMPGWRWIFTPGHTVGHVSLWREADRALIAGDAFIATNQESAYAVAMQAPELHGPPLYYTVDWQAAKQSVAALAAAQPEFALTGHGPALRGAGLRTGLTALAARFDEVAVPRGHRYAKEPAHAVDGTAYSEP